MYSRNMASDAFVVRKHRLLSIHVCLGGRGPTICVVWYTRHKGGTHPQTQHILFHNANTKESYR